MIVIIVIILIIVISSIADSLKNPVVYNAKDIYEVTHMYNLMEYGDNYFKTSWSSWQYHSGVGAVNNSGTIIAFDAANIIGSFNYKEKIIGQTDDKGTKDIEIIAPLNYLWNFWRTLEIPLIKCEINLIVTCSANYVRVSSADANQGETFATTDTKL